MKNYLLALVLLFISCNSDAFIWDKIVGCLSDPCDCGQDKITESWNSKSKNPQITEINKPGTLCPPWNRRDGREQDTCLLKSRYPEKFTLFYLNRCAESTDDSTYFDPKIRIRIQNCNAVACWSKSATLSANGECVLWPTGYALPLTRVCARIAMPAITPHTSIGNAANTPADPGYTQGFHLNEVGYTEPDEQIVGVDGKINTFLPPKLCAYSDPGLINLISDSGPHTDTLDWNPNSQPLHKTTDLSPIAKVLKFMIEKLGNANFPSTIAKLLDMMGADDSESLKVLKHIFEAIGKIFSKFSELAIVVVRQFGSLNSAVDDYSFGCVLLPFGPSPPPYCPSLSQINVLPVINNICSIKHNGLFQQSSTIAPCVVSKIRNNIINNSVRVSFNNFVPLCTGKDPDLHSCVQLNNIDSFSSAKAVHTTTAYLDVIKSCKTAGSGSICFNTKAKGAKDQGRIIYSQKIGSLDTPSDYFISDLPDCGTGEAQNSTTCQRIWGVNIGNFIDTSVTFPRIQDQNNLSAQQTIFSLTDNNDQSRSFYASITNVHTDKQSPENICVFESSNLIGCIPRASTNYTVATYECNNLGISCDSTYYIPRFIASVQVRDKDQIVDQTSTVVTPLSYSANRDSNMTEAIVKLAAYDYSSSVAFIPKIPPNRPEDHYIAMPFSGDNSINSLSIHGKYKNNILPYDHNSRTVNSSAVYLKYLEYINGKYVQGGTHACLMPKNFQSCKPMASANNGNNHNTEINCVLAHLESSTTNTQTVVSRDYRNRINPDPNIGPILNESQYYIVEYKTDGSVNYDKSTSGLRDKTPLELNLCVPIPIPKCREKTENSATWPTTDIGEISTGKCAHKDWITIIPNDPLERYCLSDIESRTVSFEKIPKDRGCRESKGITLVQKTNTFPPHVRTSNNYTPSGKTGSFSMGEARHKDGTFHDSTRIYPTYKGKDGVAQGTYQAEYTFDVDAILDDIEYFHITQVAYDDCALVKINGKSVLNVPAGTSKDDIIKGFPGSCNSGKDQKASRDADKSGFTFPIDIKSRLQRGQNTITFQLGVLGSGGMYYHMEYKMKR